MMKQLCRWQVFIAIAMVLTVAFVPATDAGITVRSKVKVAKASPPESAQEIIKTTQTTAKRKIKDKSEDEAILNDLIFLGLFVASFI